MKRVLTLLTILAVNVLGYSQQNCSTCQGAGLEADILYSTLQINDCTATLSYPFGQLSCDESFTIEWNDGDTGIIDSHVSTSASTTYTSVNIDANGQVDETVSIYVLRNGLTCGPYVYQIYPPPTCDPTFCQSCPGANAIANIVYNSLNTLDGCTYTLSYPFISIDCDYSFEVSWNGEVATLFTFGDTIETTFSQNGDYPISITVINDGIDICGTFTSYQGVNFLAEVENCVMCEDPCRYNLQDTEINIQGPSTRDGCDYTFKVDLEIPGCFDGVFSYFWSIIDESSNVVATYVDDFSTEQISSWTYDFSNNVNQSYKVGLYIVYYTEDGSARLCDFLLDKEKIDVHCGLDCVDPCDLDLEINAYTDNQCEYIFSPVIAFPCSGVTYEYAWNVISVGPNPLGYGENFTYEFSGENTEETVQLTIIATKQDGKVCDKQVFTISVFPDCSENATIGISPNPIRRNEQLTFNGIDIGDLKDIGIYDFWGNQKMKLNPSSYSINLQGLKSGMYFLVFNTESGRITKQLVIK